MPSTPSSSPARATPSSDNDIALGVGLGVGIAVLAIAVIAMWIVYWRRRRGREIIETTESRVQSPATGNRAGAVSGGGNGGSRPMTEAVETGALKKEERTALIGMRTQPLFLQSTSLLLLLSILPISILSSQLLLLVLVPSTTTSSILGHIPVPPAASHRATPTPYTKWNHRSAMKHIHSGRARIFERRTRVKNDKSRMKPASRRMDSRRWSGSRVVGLEVESGGVIWYMTIGRLRAYSVGGKL
ncbi:hypothetical protein BU26DRAFT_500806 [Trematosphaeria pertusa]|uniref:Uncharacterized protein n=1 Tax=Trematosphaeria pertusa TaxID=390896 RepID=A0A6A6IYR7_9PLEO|nr:uncharacterized protein BU26DRAFT_500806 [Trematosphaeria pertusa]KAF2255197.1 hypothetical protein BU26DRAFT_500806 [Trematosphaeria pertusa]